MTAERSDAPLDEPAAWMSPDGSVCAAKNKKKISAHGHHDNYSIPLYTAQRSETATSRDAVLEEAAHAAEICAGRQEGETHSNRLSWNHSGIACADAIRALKNAAPQEAASARVVSTSPAIAQTPPAEAVSCVTAPLDALMDNVLAAARVLEDEIDRLAELARPSRLQLSGGWMMWATGDGGFSRHCITEVEVRTFIAEAVFGSVESADDLEVNGHLADFNDPEQWSGREWHVRFEDGSINALRLDAEVARSPRVPQKLWLWRNFVDGRPEYWAFDNPYPCQVGGGDPMVLGEPRGYAIFKESTLSRNHRATPEAETIAAIKREAKAKL